jgi:hypothetical protein
MAGYTSINVLDRPALHPEIEIMDGYAVIQDLPASFLKVAPQIPLRVTRRHFLPDSGVYYHEVKNDSVRL